MHLFKCLLTSVILFPPFNNRIKGDNSLIVFCPGAEEKYYLFPPFKNMIMGDN
jgi:hypothetical protein